MFEQGSAACAQHGHWSVQGDEGTDCSSCGAEAKIAGAELRAVEERRKADERDAAMKLKRATERAAAEEASIRRATVRPRASNTQ